MRQTEVGLGSETQLILVRTGTTIFRHLIPLHGLTQELGKEAQVCWAPAVSGSEGAIF